MPANIQQWLDYLPYDSPLARRQALVLQRMLLFIVGGALAGMGLSPISNLTTASLTFSLTLYGMVLLGALAGLALLRHGAFRAAGATIVATLIIVLSLAMAAYGEQHIEYTLPGLVAPIVLAGLVIGRRALWIACGAAIVSIALNTLGEVYLPQWFGSISTPDPGPIAFIAGYTLVVVVISLFLDRFGSALREALNQAHERERELEALRASLEQQVAERTASLQQTINELRTSQETVRALSAPALPVLPGVLVLPLIGAFDSRRIADLNRVALNAVDQRRAKVVIFDVTGIALLDTSTAQALLQTAAAVRLLGAESWLVGLRAEVTQTIVMLGVDLRAFRAFASLEDAIGALVRNNNQRTAPAIRGARVWNGMGD
ncbi:STAS domain-containing protein [Roseiflexus sp.]|uniref:STAS domain-containing protein n=1 Tax=Roseiflexus sp. TaxID=2562120 RepID=UPI0021DE6CC9|nr:STAS domain-containing protein [Roseiflexus sp.]GIW00462.1 MAG: anti-sigma factor antagonist [Roseiflexus sp.]